MSAPAINPPAALLEQIATPIVAWRMRNELHACSLHHDRARAEQAAVDHRGQITELVEFTSDLRNLVRLHNAAAWWLDGAGPSDPVLLATDIARRAVIEDLEDHADRVVIDGDTWFDTAAMTSEHEHSHEVIDMARQALAFATLAGLIHQHPSRAGLVCIAHQHQPASR